MRRITSVELLDLGLLKPDEVQGNLDDLWRINRYLGGVSGSLSLLGRYFRRTGRRRLRVLDVGAGDGRLAGSLRRELRHWGIEAEFFVLDCRLSHLEVGRPVTEGLHPVVANAVALPFRERSFDLVTCNLFLHHFSGERALALLGALGSVARDAVVINDLARHWLPFLFVRVAPWFWRHRASRLDGMASVRQAYTRSELEELASAAGFGDFEVYPMAPFRLGLTLWNTPSPAAENRVKAEAVNVYISRQEKAYDPRMENYSEHCPAFHSQSDRPQPLRPAERSSLLDGRHHSNDRQEVRIRSGGHHGKTR
ncbi:MAG TPA: methyltransferase domain-containing protein [Terriglobia bacterium]